MVAGDDDDLETSSYYIKDALDANFTYHNASYSNNRQLTGHHGRLGGAGMGGVSSGGYVESGLRRQPYQQSAHGQGTVMVF